jgi:hypothetical protein
VTEDSAGAIVGAIGWIVLAGDGAIVVPPEG